MAGPAAVVHVLPASVENKPKPMDLSSPESTVRSYLDWTSYAYRITQSEVATAAMGPDESTRVDAYIQYFLEKQRLIDQTLQSITFGTPVATKNQVLLPTVEKWTYRYVSTTNAGKTVGGPYAVSYDSTYTVVKSGDHWVVNSVKARALGTVK
jgi:hypothetical protein